MDREFARRMSMRSVSSSAVALALALTFASPAGAEILTVRVATANFREGPSEEHSVVFTADRYFPVKVIAKKRGWVQVVDFENEKAWVAGYLLSPSAGVVVRVQRANVRSAPNLDAKVVTKVEYGQAFHIERRDGRWLQIADSSGKVGWIRSDMTWGDEGG